VAGLEGEGFEFVGEGAVDEDCFEIGAFGGLGPDFIGAGGVGGEGDGGIRGFDDQAGGGDFVRDGDGGELHAIEFEGFALAHRDPLDRGLSGVEHFDLGEIGPEDAVEEVILDGFKNGGGAVDAERALEKGKDLGDGDGETGDVIHVGVGEDDVADFGELVAREGEAETAGIDGDGGIDQEAGEGLKLRVVAGSGGEELDGERHVEVVNAQRRSERGKDLLLSRVQDCQEVVKGFFDHLPPLYFVGGGRSEAVDLFVVDGQDGLFKV